MNRKKAAILTAACLLMGSAMPCIPRENVIASADSGVFDPASVHTVTMGNWDIGYIIINEDEIEILSISASGDETLRELTIPEEIGGLPVKGIGEYAMSENSTIEKLVIPDSVTRIGRRAFMLCACLSEVTLSKNLTSLGQDAFMATSWYYEISNEAGSKPLIVGNVLIEGIGCSGDIEIPDGVRCIADGAFKSRDMITSVVFPESVEYIGAEALYNCPSLSLVTVNNPDCVIYDDSRTISSSEIEDPAFNGVIHSAEGSKAQEYAEKYGIAWEKFDTVGTELVRDGVVYRLYSDHAVVLKAEDAPLDLVIPEMINDVPVTGIADLAFLKADMRSVTMGNSVKHIGDGAFAGCERLEEITLPKTVSTLGGGVFAGCRLLKSVTLPMFTESLDALSYEMYEEYDLGGMGFFEGCASLEEVVIPYDLTGSFRRVGDRAFLRCASLKTVKLPESTRTIGEGAFAESGIEEIVMPKKLERVAPLAFTDCGALREITVLNSNCEFQKLEEHSLVPPIHKGYDSSTHDHAVSLTLIGEENSTAQTLAEEYGYGFRLIGSENAVLYGDANLDGKVTIADATAILQAIGNPDKYGLSAAAAANADCCNTGDGLSGMDALAVQMYDAKLINSLPYVELPDQPLSKEPFECLSEISFTEAVDRGMIQSHEYNRAVKAENTDYSQSRYYKINNAAAGIADDDVYLYNSADGTVIKAAEDAPVNRAVWYWKGSKAAEYGLDDDDEAQGKFFDALELYGITEVYYSMGANKLVKNADTVRRFVRNAYDRGMRVYLLTGENTWLYEDSYESSIYRVFDRVSEYNGSSAYNERLAGVSYDAEVWTNKSWDWKGDETIRAAQVKHIAEARRYADSKGLSVSFCLPFWIVRYDFTDDAGNVRNVYDAITELLSETIIMAYRDSAKSVVKLVNEVQNGASESIMAYNEKNGCLLEIALQIDENKEGDSLTFLDEEQEHPGAVLDAIAEIEGSLKDHEENISYAIHQAVTMFELTGMQ